MGERTIKNKGSRFGWILLLSAVCFFVSSTPSLAQDNIEKCRGAENFLKCHKEIYAKAHIGRGKTGSRSAELNKLKMPAYQEYLSKHAERHKHLKEIQSNSRRVKERVIAGVDRFIKNFRRVPAK